jgi:hypothetical protein
MGNNCENNCFNSKENKSEIKTEKTLNTNFEYSNTQSNKFNSTKNLKFKNLKYCNIKLRTYNEEKNENLNCESTIDSKIFLKKQSCNSINQTNKNYKKIYSFNIKNKNEIKKIKTIQKTFRMFQTRNLFKNNLKHIFLCDFYEILNKKGIFISLFEFIEKIPSNIKNKLNFSINRLKPEKFFNSTFNSNYIKTFSYSIIEQPFCFNSNFFYYGQWNYKGEFHGYGILLFDDLTLVEGYFVDNKINGNGKIFFKNGDFFEGEIKNNLKCGKGKYFFQNGSIFTGNFINNNINGYGILNFNENKIYKGFFNNNLIDGNGEFIYSNKTKFVGKFSKNLRNGFGIYYYNKEETVYYKGNWKNGLQNGEGEFRLENGKIIKGLFKNGKIIQILDDVNNNNNLENSVQNSIDKIII